MPAARNNGMVHIPVVPQTLGCNSLNCLPVAAIHPFHHLCFHQCSGNSDNNNETIRKKLQEASARFIFFKT